MLRRLPRRLLSRNTTCAMRAAHPGHPRGATFQSVGGRTIADQQSNQTDEIVAIPVAVDVRLAGTQRATERDTPIEALITDDDIDRRRTLPNRYLSVRIVNRHTPANESVEPRRQQPPAYRIEPRGAKRLRRRERPSSWMNSVFWMVMEDGPAQP